MPDDTTIKATIATLTAAGLDVNTTSVRGVCVVVVTDRQTGERYIHRDADEWLALVRAAESAGFDFRDARDLDDSNRTGRNGDTPQDRTT